jgi:hypothetical protein
MKEIKLFAALWFVVLSFSSVAAGSDSLECPVAEEIAQKSYDRTASSFNSGDKNAAIMYSKSFFDIYEISGSCTFVKDLAEKLNSIGITQSAVVSSRKALQIPSGVGALVNACQNPPCKITLTTPSNGHYNGIQKPDLNFVIP